MMHWFRTYSEIRDDPKILELDDHQFRLWIGLLSLASESDRRGTVTARKRGLAAALRTDEERLATFLSLASDLDMLSLDADNAIVITHWQERQPPSDQDPTRAERQRRYRQKRAAANRTQSVDVGNALPSASRTTPVTPLDTDTDRDRDEEETPCPTDTRGEEELPAAVKVPVAVKVPAAPERDKPARVVDVARGKDDVQATSEPRVCDPYDLYLVLCEELNAPVEAPPPPKQMGIAKRLCRRYDAEEVRACLRFLTSQHWRQAPVDLATVESQIEAWVLAGRPEAELPPRQRPRAIPNPADEFDYERNLLWLSGKRPGQPGQGERA